MKQQIIKLLLEEYKQNSYFNELADRGIDLRLAAIDIYDIIFDLIGFPADGTEIPAQSLTANSNYNKASILNGAFTRDYLYEKYLEAFKCQRSMYKIIADESGLNFENLEGHADAEKRTTLFVDWLYQEIEKIP